MRGSESGNYHYNLHTHVIVLNEDPDLGPPYVVNDVKVSWSIDEEEDENDRRLTNFNVK